MAPTYRSNFEDDQIADLGDRGVSFEYEPWSYQYFDHECPSCGEGIGEHWYTPDVHLENGVVIEYKGYFRKEDRKKIRLVKKWWPDLDLRMVFKSNDKVSGCKSQRVLDWCKKHGIPAAVGSVPKEWL